MKNIKIWLSAGFLAIIFALITACPSGDDSGKNSASNISVTVPDDFAGLCHTGYSADLGREYGMLEELGVIWLHRDFSWSRIEPSEGNWDFSSYDAYVQRANAEGKKIMGMLLYDVDWVHDKYAYPHERRIREEQIPHFVNYAVETVKRYNGKNGYGCVDAWLIWNEPDLQPRFWTGTQEEFFALTKATAEAVRELDAEEETAAVLVGGVFTALVTDDWIDGLFASGAMDRVDGIAFHPYSPDALGSLGFLDSFKKKMEPYGFADKIWVNEMGFPSYSDPGPIPSGRYGTDRYEGDMPEEVAKTFAVMAAAGAKKLTWYHMFDGSDRRNNNSEDWFGLVWQKSSAEWEKKGGYWGFALCAKNIPGKIYKNKTFYKGSAPGEVYSYYFEGNDGKRTLLVWNDHPLVTRTVTLSLPGSNHRLWDLETGQSVPVNKTSAHTLHPPFTFQKTMAFLTWDE